MREVEIEIIIKLLKKIAQKGYVQEEELTESEKNCINKLIEHGIVKRCYVIAPEYRDEVLRLCKPKVLTVPTSGRRAKLVQLLVTLAFMTLPAYLTAVSLMLGPQFIEVTLLFLLLTAGLGYLGYQVSRRLASKLAIL